MIALRNVLVPTDFSEPAKRAVEYAKAFAQNFHAVIHILHVAEDVTLDDPTQAALSLAEIQKNTLTIQSRLNELFTADERSRLRVTTAIVEGNPHDAILTYAEDHAIELIILGTHGRGAIKQFILGSVAERIVRHARCPVLTVKADKF